MSDPTEHRSALEQPMYITKMLFFVITFSCLQLVAVFGLFFAIYGVPKIDDFWTIQVPDYSHATLWKGQVWYSVMKTGPNQSSSTTTLLSLDPEKGEPIE